MSKSMTLEQRARDYANRFEDYQNNSIAHDAYIQGATDAVRWFSVEEERPDYGQIVIVRLLDGEAHQARLQKDDMWDEWGLLNQDLDYESVSHWMPLPPAPEDKCPKS